MTEPRTLTDAIDLIAEIAHAADDNIGNTANREGDAYQQGVRDLAAALAGLDPMPDTLRIGTIVDALKAGDLSKSNLTAPNLRDLIGHEQRPIEVDYDRCEADLAEIIRRHQPNAVAVRVGVDEWDDGYWYNTADITALLADGSEIFVSEAALMAAATGLDYHNASEALTELSERDAPLGRGSELRIIFQTEAAK